jgi:DNA-binding response OmpR family regulator
MKRVIIFEDEHSIADILAIVLKNQYQVYTFYDGTDFESVITDTHPDLVLLDLNLGEIDGQEICQYIKSKAALKHIPVILMSASTRLEVVKERCGAEDMISKPFDIQTVFNKLEQWTT